MKISPFRFNTPASAKAFIGRTTLPSKWQIVMGDDATFWVVTAREACYLVKQGFEIFE